MYMGIPMTTSSQAWTAPALHSDMHVFRVSSACWRRSSCSSPSDRLCCVRLSESGLVRRSYGVAYRRISGSVGYENQIRLHIWRQSEGSRTKNIASTLKWNHTKLHLGQYTTVFSVYRGEICTPRSIRSREKKNCYITTRWRQIILLETASIFE